MLLAISPFKEMLIDMLLKDYSGICTAEWKHSKQADMFVVDLDAMN